MQAIDCAGEGAGFGGEHCCIAEVLAKYTTDSSVRNLVPGIVYSLGFKVRV
jgi:hypothetical protein